MSELNQILGIKAASTKGNTIPSSAEGVGNDRLMARYRSGYWAARMTIAAGTMVKIVAVAAALAMGIASMSLTQYASRQASTWVMTGGALGSIVIGAAMLILGTVIVAQGEMLKATIDIAVNGSTLLTEAQRSELIGQYGAQS
jgi:hypothetical protein